MDNGSNTASLIFWRRARLAGDMDNRIKELRTELGLTQEELAQKARVRRETIVFLEQGKYNPSLELAFRVAKALKTKVDELFDL